MSIAGQRQADAAGLAASAVGSLPDSVETPAYDHDSGDSGSNDDSKDSGDSESDGHHNGDSDGDSDGGSDGNSDGDSNGNSDDDSDGDGDGDTDRGRGSGSCLFMLCLAFLYSEFSEATKMFGVMPAFHWYREPDDGSEHTCHNNNPTWKQADLTQPNVFIPAHVESVRVEIKTSLDTAYQRLATDSGYSALGGGTGQPQFIMVPAFQRGSSPDGREYIYLINKDMSAAPPGNWSTGDKHFKIGETVCGTLEVYDNQTDICLAQSTFDVKLHGSVASSGKPLPSRASHVFTEDDLYRVNHLSAIPSSTRIQSTAIDL